MKIVIVHTYESTCQCRRHRWHSFHLWVRKIPWRRKWQPAPVFLPAELHGQRSLKGYSPWGCKELDMTERTHTHTHTHTTWWNVHEIPIVWGLGAFQVGWTHPLTGRVRHASSMRTEVPVLRTLPGLGLHISSSGCSSVSFIISFNTLVNISKCSWVLWAVLGNNWI